MNANNVCHMLALDTPLLRDVKKHDAPLAAKYIASEAIVIRITRHFATIYRESPRGNKSIAADVAHAFGERRPNKGSRNSPARRKFTTTTKKRRARAPRDRSLRIWKRFIRELASALARARERNVVVFPDTFLTAAMYRTTGA